MGFFFDGMHRNNPPVWLLKLLVNLPHRFSAVLTNFSGKHPSVSNSQFCGSDGSEHIPTVTSFLSLANHVGHCRFWVLKIAGYVTYGSAISVVLTITSLSNSESSEQRAILPATACHLACDCVPSWMRLLPLLFLTCYFTAAAVTCIRTADIVVCRGFQLFVGR